MRRVLFILSLFMLVCGCIEARTIIVEIGNIRGNHGNILVMAQSGKDTKPVYGMAKSEKGKVTIRLENVDWEKFYLSVFSMTRTTIGKWICWKEKGLRKDMCRKVAR